MKKRIGAGLMAQGAGESSIKTAVVDLVLSSIDSGTYEIDLTGTIKSRRKAKKNKKLCALVP